MGQRLFNRRGWQSEMVSDDRDFPSEKKCADSLEWNVRKRDVAGVSGGSDTEACLDSRVCDVEGALEMWRRNWIDLIVFTFGRLADPHNSMLMDRRIVLYIVSLFSVVSMVLEPSRRRKSPYR